MTTILAYVFYFIAASASPLQRRWIAVHREGEHGGQIHFAFHVTLVIAFLCLFIPLFVPIEPINRWPYVAFLTSVCGIVGGGWYIFNYIAQKHVDAGITTIVNNLYTPVTILLATVLLNEALTAIQLIGTGLLLIATAMISKKHRIGRFNFDKYFWLMVLGGVSLGVFLIAFRELQIVSGFTVSLVLSFWGQMAFLGLAALAIRSRSTHTAVNTVVTGVLQFFQHLSWGILTFVVANVSLAAAVTTFKVVVIFVLAAIFLKEREDLPRKIIGSFIAVAGLLLMK